MSCCNLDLYSCIISLHVIFWYLELLILQDFINTFITIFHFHSFDTLFFVYISLELSFPAPPPLPYTIFMESLDSWILRQMWLIAKKK